ncbi:putative endonuclease [Babesia sp. Xinjiang]|uniref:putative endonuclease n=1 Tax=Babesia sp. Xinjiang TaxID=462227 RepID=UPI000A215139|nr:putative endonuclease [Babesia sp. Xinjiang]ORM39356.1 putative endonuclease [Babesia sp. Xinjiang]
MGINGLIQFLCARFPDSIVATPTLEGLGGTRIFVDCAILLRRNLHAAATAILSRRRLEYSRASEAERQFIDVRSIRNEICNHATKPLLRLNQQLRAVRSNGGTQATFVLGSSITVRDLYIASKTGSPDHATNVLDIRNQHLVPALRAFFERKASGRLYAAPSEKDMLMIAQRLTDAFARVEVRQPDIARRCVEFCDQEDDHVLSDDTNTIAYGAPNVIRDYFGRNVCNTINQRKMLQLMGLTRSQFIDFCILCGLEGTPLIPHIGPERAYRIISNFKTLEAFLESTVLESVLRAPNVAKSLEKVL